MEEAREDSIQEKPVEGKSEEPAAQAEEDAKPPAEGTAEREASVEETEVTAEQEMARMQQELEEANDTMLRLAAELDNYKKRVAKERESLIKYATQDIIQELLPVLDNFERAIESANKSKDSDSLLEGVRMIFKQMYDTLGRKGVSRIDAVGKAFDPTIHEAVMQITSEEHPENVVVEELQKGYMLHDRVIRPSIVAVSRSAAARQEEE
jgi:molecular chaperone GrpE